MSNEDKDCEERSSAKRKLKNKDTKKAIKRKMERKGHRKGPNYGVQEKTVLEESTSLEAWPC